MKLRKWSGVGIGVGVLLLWSSCTPVMKPAATAINNGDPYEQLAVYAAVQELLREQYLDADAVGYDALTAGALKGMLGQLDHYSTYDTPEEFAMTMRELSGEQIGIGVVVAKAANEFIRVIAALPDTPAFEAGIRAGDEIFTIDGTNTAELNIDECMKLMRGEAGTEVTVEVYRNNDYDNPASYQLERRQFHRSSVPEHGTRMLTGDIGYIQIESFTEMTGLELDLALHTLQKNAGCAGLILDLRNNPGGMLDAAVEVCSRFIEPGELVVSVEGRTPDVLEKYHTRSKSTFFAGPVVILTNCFSASAAEIVAGSMHDLERAILVGETTFGKGTVQRIFPLPNGGAVRFSIAQYFTPSHRQIHGVGIPPDVELVLSSDEDSRLADQLMLDPNTPWEGGPERIPDPQLDLAVEVLTDRLHPQEPAPE